MRNQSNPKHPTNQQVSHGIHWLRAQRSEPELVARLRSQAASLFPLDEAALFHFDRPGKLLRSKLVLATCSSFGVVDEGVYALAVACELLHNASLIHDDLQDRDPDRRGQEAVWNRFGDDVALLLGDQLIAAAFRVLSEADAPSECRLRWVRAFAESTRTTVAGQVLDLGLMAEPQTTLAAYENFARLKTAPLLCLPVECAWSLCRSNPFPDSAREALGHLGLAYQIRDDLLDLFGRKRAGRTSDLLEGKLTSPIVCYLEHASPLQVKQLEHFLHRPRTTETIRHWCEVLKKSEAPDRSLGKLEQACRQAEVLMGGLPKATREVVGTVAKDLLRSTREMVLGARNEVQEIAQL